MNIFTIDPGDVGRFSWSDVKNVATAILENCEMGGRGEGVGGVAAVIEGSAWVVDIAGIERGVGGIGTVYPPRERGNEPAK